MSIHPSSWPARRSVCVRYLGATLLGDVIWETLHLPLYTLWQTSSAQYLTFVVIHCSVGDLMIAASVLLIAVVVAGRRWPQLHYNRVAFIAIAFGFAYTMFSEWLNVSVRGSWAYAVAMPVVPVLGTGVSPLMQWVVVPAFAFLFAYPGVDVKKT